MFASFVDEFQKLAASKHRLQVSKSREGRRSMRVDTLLKKDNNGTLFKKHAWQDQLPGGLADDKKPDDFPATALMQGRRVESEHTSNKSLATEIAMDHLTEDPSYYKKLEKVEKSAGLMDILKTPIPGTKDWFINTGKSTLQGAGKVTGALKRRPMAGTRTSGGVTSIGADELKRLGFGDITKRAFKLQGHTQFQGLPLAIENRKGSTREGVDPDGKPWKTTFEHPYGYIKGTEGKDGEEIDAYVGPHKDAPEAYVVHQRHITGKGHDEDKVMLGFHSEEEARAAYLKHYNKVGPKLLGSVSTLTIDELKKKLEEKRKHTKLAAKSLDDVEDALAREDLEKAKKSGNPTAISRAQGTLAVYGKKKLAWDGTGSGSGPTGNRMAMVDLDEKPDRFKKGDVPSRDGTSPGAAKVERHEAGTDFMTTLPTNGAMASSETGATTRL